MECDVRMECGFTPVAVFVREDTGLGGERGGKYYWDPKIIFGGICSFCIIGNDETNVLAMSPTSTYRD
jgi:hypothetical protein